MTTTTTKTTDSFPLTEKERIQRDLELAEVKAKTARDAADRHVRAAELEAEAARSKLAAIEAAEREAAKSDEERRAEAKRRAEIVQLEARRKALLASDCAKVESAVVDAVLALVAATPSLERVTSEIDQIDAVLASLRSERQGGALTEIDRARARIAEALRRKFGGPAGSYAAMAQAEQFITALVRDA